MQCSWFSEWTDGSWNDVQLKRNLVEVSLMKFYARILIRSFEPKEKISL